MYGTWAQKSALKKSGITKIVASILVNLVGYIVPVLAFSSKDTAGLALLISAFFGLTATVLWFWGLAQYAKSKGHSGWMAALGLLFLVGWLILALLPDKWKQHIAANPGAYAVPEVPSATPTDVRDEWEAPAAAPPVAPAPVAPPAFISPNVAAPPVATAPIAAAPPVAPPAPAVEVPAPVYAPPAPVAAAAPAQSAPRRATTGFPPASRTAQMNAATPGLQSAFPDDALEGQGIKTRNRKYAW
jgi:hypothetical protein